MTTSSELTQALERFRFGVNYTPTRQWYYSWNDFEADSIRRDLDAIRTLGADHIRLQLIWPWFQPNPGSVSAAHLERLRTVLLLAAERDLDVCVTALDGWLSGYAFVPAFGVRESIYTSPLLRAAQEKYFTALAGTVGELPNFLGFDLGNEMNCCWSAPCAEGDAWFAWALDLLDRLSPGRLHVNGVDQNPWFQETTFSPLLLARRPALVALHCWTFFTGAIKRDGPLGRCAVGLAAGMTALAQAYAGDRSKPIWIQEFGAAPEWMPPRDIPDFLERTIRQAVAAGARWFTWWSSHDVDRRLTFDALEYELGLIRLDQTIKPHGERFRELANEFRGRRPVVPTHALPAPPEQRNYTTTWQWLEDWLRTRDGAVNE